MQIFFMNANFYKHFEMYKFSNFYYGLVKQIKFKSKMGNATRIIQRVLQLGSTTFCLLISIANP